MIFNTTTPEQIEKLLADNPEQYIPYGYYCHSLDDEHLICPFWDFDDELPEQENGYCHLLKMSDFNENPIRNKRTKITYAKDSSLIGKSVSETMGDHEPSSLLWDKCKECHINIKVKDDGL